MGQRYLRTFHCEDCDQVVTRKWQTGRQLVCMECGKVRFDIATTAAREAVQAHKARMRLEVLARRAARLPPVPLLRPLEELERALG